MAYKRKFRSRSRRSRRGKYGRRRRGNFASRVKRVLMKNSETKRSLFGLENAQLYHNSGYQTGIPATEVPNAFMFNPWAGISSGTGRTNRIGDQIVPRGLSLRIWLSNKLDRPNLLYRIVIGVVSKIYSGVVQTGSFDFMTLVSFTGNNIVRPIDPEKINVLYDRVFKNSVGNSENYSGAGKEYQKFVDAPRLIIYIYR